MDKYVAFMLPCAVQLSLIKHSYCRECLDKFVLNQEEKKCPQCRKEFNEPKQIIERKLAEIVDHDEKDIMNQIRTNIKEFLRRTNPNIGEI